MKYQKQKLVKKKIKTISIATRKIKYLGINLTREVKDMCSESYTIFKNKIKEDTNKWSIYHAHELEEWTSLNYSYYPKQSTNSMQFLSKYQSHISQIKNISKKFYCFSSKVVSTYPTTLLCPNHAYLPPTIIPTFGIVHGSFILLPWWPFPVYPPLSLSPIPSVTVSLFLFQCL